MVIPIEFKSKTLKMKTSFTVLAINYIKIVLFKTFLFLFLFQFSVVKAQNPILLDHTWYFEIGNMDDEILVTPPVPEEFPNDYDPISSTLIFSNENGVFRLFPSNNYCDLSCNGEIVFLNNENIFSSNNDGFCFGMGCEFGPASDFLNSINYFFGINTNIEAINPFSYTIDEDDNYYKLTITNNDGDWLVYNSVLLSNPTFNEKTLSLFPNPVQNILNIQSTASNLSKVQIYDLNGRLLKNHTLQNNDVSLEVSGLQSGVYVVVLENEIGQQISRKIVKTIQ
jgi:hypothetical protein